MYLKWTTFPYHDQITDKKYLVYERKEDEVPTSVEKDREIKTMIKRNLEQKLYQMRRPVIDLI